MLPIFGFVCRLLWILIPIMGFDFDSSMNLILQCSVHFVPVFSHLFLFQNRTVSAISMEEGEWEGKGEVPTLLCVGRVCQQQLRL